MYGYMRWLLLVSLIACWQCRPAADNSAMRGDELLASWQELACQEQLLAAMSQSLWDSVTQELATQLPTDMPAQERNNMLAVRNANLIQMFEVYNELPVPLKNLVQEAGQEDTRIAYQVRQLKTQIDSLQYSTDQFLSALEQRNRPAFRDWQFSFQQARSKPCTRDPPSF